MRNQLLEWIDKDHDEITRFVQTLVQERSPTPPGNTVGVMKHIRELLDRHKVSYQLLNKDETMPNLVATTQAENDSRHLVLNGHIDVFPVESAEGWICDPWGGEIRDGKLYGRGVADMKVGTNASIWTFIYLSRLVEQLKGKLTLTVVSDEERLGPNGAIHLFDAHPDLVT